MHFSQYESYKDLPLFAPVFPLSGILLLPRGQLPLNVFEPRYISLVDHCLAGNRTMIIVQPDTSDYQKSTDMEESPQGNPSLARIGCLARLTGFMETSENQYFITLTGISRIRLNQELDNDELFREFAFSGEDFPHDLTAEFGAHEVNRTKIITTLRQYVDAHDLSVEWESINEANNEELVNSLAMISPFGAPEKQALLEATTLKERCELLIAMTEKDLSKTDVDHSITLQ